jgi:hypothetical protein
MVSPLKVVPIVPTKDAAAPAKSAANRRTPRRIFRRPVGVMVRGHYVVLDGRSISEGGLLVALGDRGDHSSASRMSLDELPVEARVSVSIILPAGSTLVLRGKVIYQEGDEAIGHSIGIKFEAVPLQQRRDIRIYVSSKEAGEADLED